MGDLSQWEVAPNLLGGPGKGGRRGFWVGLVTWAAVPLAGLASLSPGCARAAGPRCGFVTASAGTGREGRAHILPTICPESQ